MADLIADLKRLRLYGMAACVAEGLEQGQPALATATALLAALVQAEATDRATRSVRYQMHAARFPMHRDLTGIDRPAAQTDHALATMRYQVDRGDAGTRLQVLRNRLDRVSV